MKIEIRLLCIRSGKLDSILISENCRWSSPEKEENFTDSASSTPEFMFEFTDPSLRGEVNSNMNSGVLELKLDKVHFADKFFRAELARRRRNFLQSAPSAVSTPMSTRRYAKYPDAKLVRRGVLGLPLS